MFWLAIVATATATVLYWGYAFGARVAVRRLATDGPSLTLTTWERLPASVGRAATAVVWLAIALLGAALVARWRATDHAPWSNMWEYTVAFAWGVSFAYAVFERWYGQRTLGSLALPVALGLMITAAIFFPSDVKPLVPALQNQTLLTAHVAMMVLSYSALSVSFGSAVMYLIQGEGNRFARLPRASLLDEIGYRSVMVGFPMLALGIALGAYWGNSAWGRYWGWDPKETSALVTWLIYAVYLHARSQRGWAGRPSALILVLGFGAVLFTYFGNLYFTGLHAYSGL